MITHLRHYLIDSWVGRVIALLVFFAFVGWGAGDYFFSGDTPNGNSIIKVGDRNISPNDFAQAFSRGLQAQAQQMGLSDPSRIPASTKHEIASIVLHNLVIQREIQLAAQRSNMVVPDELVRKEIFSLPVFHNAAGQFDRSKFNDTLRRIGLTEGRFIALMREDINSRSLMQGMGSSVQVPSSLVNHLVGFYSQQRVVDVVRIPFSGETVAQNPTEAQLHRYYDNHPQDFHAPEYRHAKIAVMTLESVEKTIEVPDDVLHKLYDFQARNYNVPETRSLQVLTFTTENDAKNAAQKWHDSNDWEAVQKVSLMPQQFLYHMFVKQMCLTLSLQKQRSQLLPVRLQVLSRRRLVGLSLT
ncbi:peptidylprolyl isomerase [Swingsia samuiensis]|uniref:peptidylprolyl isomerase n=1 Tax=Swingsia samuiensis TaxID=1293412 RepID=UPI001FE5B4BA|nr:peptidylprolyl isomerase [Swingsia samuiensis]